MASQGQWCLTFSHTLLGPTSDDSMGGGVAGGGRRVPGEAHRQPGLQTTALGQAEGDETVSCQPQTSREHVIQRL